jgi:hypothetical protein
MSSEDGSIVPGIRHSPQEALGTVIISGSNFRELCLEHRYMPISRQGTSAASRDDYSSSAPGYPRIF